MKQSEKISKNDLSLIKCYNCNIEIIDKSQKKCPNCSIILNPNDLEWRKSFPCFLIILCIVPILIALLLALFSF